ncbi:MAG: hypothetical protein ACPGVJ_07935, partial [Mangrovicoccus sp.]
DGMVQVYWFSYTSGSAGDGSGYSVQSREFNQDGTTAMVGETTMNILTTGNQYEPIATVLANGTVLLVWRSENSGGDGDGIRAALYAADGFTPIGAEFVVEDFQYSTQYHPMVAALSGGGFVIGWNSYRVNGHSQYVSRLKVYDASGNPVSDEFYVDNPGNQRQYIREIVPLANDAFAVTYQNPSSNRDSYVRVFGDPASGAVGLIDPEIIGVASDLTLQENAVNAGLVQLFGTADLVDVDSPNFAGGTLLLARVAEDEHQDRFKGEDGTAQDDFGIISTPGGITEAAGIVSYQGAQIGMVLRDGQDGIPLEITLTANASREAVEALIEALGYHNGSDDPLPSRMVDLIVTDGDGGSTGVQRLTLTIKAETDTPIAAQTEARQVNDYTTGEQHEAHIASLSDGGYVVAFRSYNQYHSSSNYDIYLQRYDADGVEVGYNILVNTAVNSGGQYNPMVTGLDNGGWVVTWRDDNGTDGSSSAVRAQIFDASGAMVGAPFTVNDYTSSYQLHPAVAQVPGGFVVAYASS